MSLRPHHGYPAALHRGLPTEHQYPIQEFPTDTHGCAPLPAHIRQIPGQ
jgi:hypothetical protein